VGPGRDAAWKVLGPSPAGPGRVVGLANQKGGVGKTTTAINLSAALALRGHRVLLVDLDPQGNATTGLGIDRRSVATSTYELMIGSASAGAICRPTRVDGLDCLPAAPDLAGAEIELVGVERREHRLAEELATARAGYDVVFVDCPPSLGLLTVNALVAATDLVVPVQCEYYALDGLGQLLRTAERVRAGFNPALRVMGFLLTMYDARTKLSSQVAAEVRGHFGDVVYESVIPRSVRLSEAPSFGEPVVTLDPGARGSISYKVLAAEFATRCELGSRASAPPPAPQPAPPPARPVTPGPGGRGFGTVAPEPAGLDGAHPRRAPWGAGA
jgi:chromosome partitioning protein